MTAYDWWAFAQFHLSVSLLAVGGAVTLAPELHSFLVVKQAWLTGAQFKQALVMAQAAPGPNVLYVALLGWHVGLGAGDPTGVDAVALARGLLGLTIALVAILLPSSLLTLLAARWCGEQRDRLDVQAFRQGMAPIVISVLLSTAWLLVKGDGTWIDSAGVWAVSAVCAVLVWRTRLHLLWMLVAGAMVGGAGWI